MKGWCFTHFHILSVQHIISVQKKKSFAFYTQNLFYVCCETEKELFA